MTLHGARLLVGGEVAVAIRPEVAELLFTESFWEHIRNAAGLDKGCYSGRHIDYPSLFLPVCEQVCADTAWLEQYLLLSEPSDMDYIATAIARIKIPSAPAASLTVKNGLPAPRSLKRPGKLVAEPRQPNESPPPSAQALKSRFACETGSSFL